VGCACLFWGSVKRAHRCSGGAGTVHLIPKLGSMAALGRHGHRQRHRERPIQLRSVLIVPTQHEALSEYRPICESQHRQYRAVAASSIADKKLVLIPLIFICLRVWSTVRFVLTLCGSPAVQTPVLVVLHVSLPSLALLPHWTWPDPSPSRVASQCCQPRQG
jgi:hypothetical protein